MKTHSTVQPCLKKRGQQATIVAIAVMAMVTGCSAVTTAPTPTKTHSATPSITVLTTITAGQRYEFSVCPGNLSTAAFNAAWAGEDLAVLKSAAAVQAANDTSAAKALDDPAYSWPSNVSADIATVRDYLFGSASVENSIAAAGTLDQAFSFSFADSATMSTASQRLRSRLNLPSDGLLNCQK